MKQPLKREFSAGGVVYKLTPQGPKFVLGQHSGYHKWVLPKGLIEPGETSQQTAIRETEEEVGVKTELALAKPIHQTQYFYLADLKSSSEEPQSTRRVKQYQEQGGQKTKVFKSVSFYLLKYLSGNPAKDHGWEMNQAGWFSYDQALAKLSFTTEKQALTMAQAKLNQL